MDQKPRDVAPSSEENAPADTSARPVPDAGSPAPAPGAREQGDQVLDIIAGVESQLARLKTARQSQEAEINALSERYEAIASAEQELESARNSIEQEQRRLAEEHDKLEAAQAELESERATWTEQHDQQETVLRQQREELNQRETALNEQREQLAAREQELESRRSALDEERAAFAEEQRELTKRVEQAESNVGELMPQLEQARTELEERESALAQAREQSESLQDELETLRAGKSESDERIAALDKELNERRNELASLEAECESLRTKLSDRQKHLELAGQKLTELSQALDEQNEQLEQGAAAMALAEQQQREIRSLKKQLESAPTPAAPVPAAEVQVDRDAHEAAIRERDTQIDALQRELDSARTAARAIDEKGDQGGADAADVELLREQIEVLQQELTEAREQAAESAAQGGPSDAPAGSNLDAERLREQARRISEVAKHLKRRRERLKRMRQLLKSRSSATRTAPGAASSFDQEQHAAQIAHLDQKRQELEAARHVLAVSENQMVRQWARSRAVTLVVWFLILIAGNAIAAWMLTDQLFPAVQTASATIEPRTSRSSPLKPETLEQWQLWHAEQFTNDRFLRTLARRMSERRLDAWADESQLRAKFLDHMTVDRGPDGKTVLTLAGTNRQELLAVLDVTVSTLVAESSRQMGVRGDQAWAVALNEREVGGQTRFATLNDWSMQNDRLMQLAAVFGGTMLLSFGAIFLVYTRLVRAKRIFDQDDVAFQDDSDGQGYELNLR